MPQSNNNISLFILFCREPVASSRHFTGRGVATYPSGDTFDGDFVDGNRHGRGTYKYARVQAQQDGDADADGDAEPVEATYTGEWRDSQKHGIGKQVYPGVGTYNGYWENGQRHGEGVMIYQNQDVYSGQWVKGNKEGKGTYVFFETGMKYVGTFKNGQLINGKWLYPNGSYFEGNFDNNKPKGKGTWNFANGNQVQGEYTQIYRADTEEADIKLSWKTKLNPVQ